MEIYKPSKGMGIYYMLGILLAYDLLFVIALLKVNSYVLISLIKIALVTFTIYQIYYILLYSTLKYATDESNIYILTFIKKIIIPFEEINSFKIENGNINGVKLSGFGTSNFALGKSVIKKIGTTNMFVTTNKNILYIKVNNRNYALTPKEFAKFKNHLVYNNINENEWEQLQDKQASLHKDKSFMIPFFAASLIITALTLNPFILYLSNKLPSNMPLNFNSAFFPVDLGTGKQFAFNQMIYGVLNMAILFCMYYASHFYAKYDKKSAKKFIYISLLIAVAFLLIQIRILHTFK
jgi:hypothetical protein